jgi:hypothetical protein
MSRMATFTRRRLTTGEVALARPVFGEEIAWPRVQIVQAPQLGFGAMAPLRHTIIFSGWRAPLSFASAALQEQGWFIHELVHVWQAARGVVLPLAKLSALGRNAYSVNWHEKDRFSAYNIEQQAEIVRALFLARAADAADAVLEKLWGERAR